MCMWASLLPPNVLGKEPNQLCALGDLSDVVLMGISVNHQLFQVYGQL